jgi:hypothetical protein
MIFLFHGYSLVLLPGFSNGFRLFTFSSETAEPLKIKGFSGCAMGECAGVKI